MKVPPLSERPDIEEDEQDFLTPPARRKKRSLAATRAALRPWAIGIGLTVLVTVASVGAYRLAAGIDWWNEHPSAAATPTAHPAPMPSASSEAAMSGGYAIGPDGVLVRPTEFAADTYTKPELPEAAKENTERGAELAAEHFLALEIYAWNTGDTQPLTDISDPEDSFSASYITTIDQVYSNGWAYGNNATITEIVAVEPVSSDQWGTQANTVGVLFHLRSTDGVTCIGQRIITNESEYESSLALFVTWKGGRWVVTGGSVDRVNAK